jgi:phosphoribosylanthranilate isomerase
MTMESATRLRVKICCISSVEEARLAVAHGVDAVGLVSRMPSGPGVIEEALITRIAAAVPPPVATFLLTCQQDADAIIEQQRRTRANTLQLCDEVPLAAYERLRTALPGVRLVQVIHVTGEAAIEAAVSVAPEVDALLLDSGRPSLIVKELGGTGRTHNWQISRQVREQVDVPVFLAGGLTPENMAEAVQQVGPFGVDVCTGVRTDGTLDPAKVARFLDQARGARS